MEDWHRKSANELLSRYKEFQRILVNLVFLISQTTRSCQNELRCLRMIRVLPLELPRISQFSQISVKHIAHTTMFYCFCVIPACLGAHVAVYMPAESTQQRRYCWRKRADSKPWSVSTMISTASKKGNKKGRDNRPSAYNAFDIFCFVKIAFMIFYVVCCYL